MRVATHSLRRRAEAGLVTGPSPAADRGDHVGRDARAGRTVDTHDEAFDHRRDRGTIRGPCFLGVFREVVGRGRDRRADLICCHRDSLLLNMWRLSRDRSAAHTQRRERSRRRHPRSFQALVLASATTARRDDPHRAVSFLELFYDLVYVAVISQAAHHLAEHVTPRGIAEFAVVFAMIWIAWIERDPVPRVHGREDGRTRTIVFAQMGILVLLAVFTADAPETAAVRSPSCTPRSSCS